MQRGSPFLLFRVNVHTSNDTDTHALAHSRTPSHLPFVPRENRSGRELSSSGAVQIPATGLTHVAGQTTRDEQKRARVHLPADLGSNARRLQRLTFFTTVSPASYHGRLLPFSFSLHYITSNLPNMHSHSQQRRRALNMSRTMQEEVNVHEYV